MAEPLGVDFGELHLAPDSCTMPESEKGASVLKWSFGKAVCIRRFVEIITLSASRALVSDATERRSRASWSVHGGPSVVDAARAGTRCCHERGTGEAWIRRVAKAGANDAGLYASEESWVRGNGVGSGRRCAHSFEEGGKVPSGALDYVKLNNVPIRSSGDEFPEAAACSCRSLRLFSVGNGDRQGSLDWRGELVKVTGENCAHAAKGVVASLRLLCA